MGLWWCRTMIRRQMCLGLLARGRANPPPPLSPPPIEPPPARVQTPPPLRTNACLRSPGAQCIGGASAAVGAQSRCTAVHDLACGAAKGPIAPELSRAARERGMGRGEGGLGPRVLERRVARPLCTFPPLSPPKAIVAAHAAGGRRLGG